MGQLSRICGTIGKDNLVTIDSNDFRICVTVSKAASFLTRFYKDIFTYPQGPLIPPANFTTACFKRGPRASRFHVVTTPIIGGDWIPNTSKLE